MNPPYRAAVLSLDEQTQTQALGRAQKYLLMKPVQPVTTAYGYNRHGTTTLVAA